jgi:hypothetical protein
MAAGKAAVFVLFHQGRGILGGGRGEGKEGSPRGRWHCLENGLWDYAKIFINTGSIGPGGFEMKRAFALICLLLLIGGMAAAAGCGDSGLSEVDADATIKEGIKSNFVDDAGNLVAFTQFGTFKLVIDDQLTEGNYGITTEEDGYHVELSFEDGQEESWSIVVTEGKVAEVVDEEGTQYVEIDEIDRRRSEET